jgi:hypothetical protein
VYGAEQPVGSLARRVSLGFPAEGRTRSRRSNVGSYDEAQLTILDENLLLRLHHDLSFSLVIRACRLERKYRVSLFAKPSS